MSQPEPRVRMPESAARGEAFEVRALITHPMETGLRHDASGAPIPRKIINRFVCRYNGVEVFSVELREAMSANPYLEFEVMARDSGTLDFAWHEDGGAIYATSREIAVT